MLTQLAFDTRVDSKPARATGDDPIVASLHRLANALKSGDCGEHETGCHIIRAAEMVRRGNAGRAALYLRTLAQNSLGQRRAILASPYGKEFSNRLLADARGTRGAAYWTASRLVLRAGVASQWLPRLVVKRETPRLEVFDVSERDGRTIASYSRSVTNSYWPELSSHGVFVSVEKTSKGCYWVELQAYPPDEARSQFVVTRRMASREEALELAEKLADLGEDVVAATVAMDCKGETR